MSNNSELELADKIKTLKQKLQNVNETKWYICQRLVKEQCPGCPLISVCENWDELYGRSVLIPSS